MDARNTTPDGVMLAGHAVQGAIVDLDGTMIDTLGDLHAAMQRTMDVLGLPAVSRAQVESGVRYGF